MDPSTALGPGMRFYQAIVVQLLLMRYITAHIEPILAIQL